MYRVSRQTQRNHYGLWFKIRKDVLDFSIKIDSFLGSFLDSCSSKPPRLAPQASFGARNCGWGLDRWLRNDKWELYSEGTWWSSRKCNSCGFDFVTFMIAQSKGNISWLSCVGTFRIQFPRPGENKQVVNVFSYTCGNPKSWRICAWGPKRCTKNVSSLALDFTVAKRTSQDNLEMGFNFYKMSGSHPGFFRFF